MARVIRFPLKMKNGAEVRSLDELKENFDLESVLGYFANGKLKTWLEDRYFDEKAEAVGALSSGMSDLNAKLCEILEVEYKAETTSIDLEVIQRRNQKLKILSTVTDDQEILRNVDIVAFNTPDINDNIYDILRTGTDKIYLYGEEFKIPAPPSSETNLRYIGVNNPLVKFLDSIDIANYKVMGISFSNVKFERLKWIKSLTDNQDAWNNPELLVTSQEELNDILNTQVDKVFLYGKEFRVPYSGEGVSYYGLNNPTVILDDGIFIEDYKDKQIEFFDVNIPEDESTYFERGKKCYKNERYDEALELYEKSEVYNKNNSEFYLYYGLLFFSVSRGDSLRSFLQRHTQWQENEIAEIALDYLRKASDLGSARACYYIGYMHGGGYLKNYNNNSYVSDYRIVKEWYKKGAAMGDSLCCFDMGMFYYDGYDYSGVSKSYSQAIDWFKKSISLGENDSTDSYICRDIVLKDNYYRDNYYYIGRAYYSGGYGITKDYVKAMEWYMKAAEYGDSYAMNNIAWLYEAGLGVPKDLSLAIYWYKKSAELENSTAQCKLGYMYENALGVSKDIAQAIEWYKKSAANGNETAKNSLKNLGVCL